MNKNLPSSPQPIACNVAELNTEQRQRQQALLSEVRSSVQEIVELTDGYALRLPAQNSMIQMAAEFIALERLCCPFFKFELEAEPDKGPLWLKLTGRQDVKKFLRAELGV